MNYKGTDLKFRVTSEYFDLTAHFFTLAVRNGRRQEICRIGKDECFQDSEGRWYFTLEDVRPNVYYVRFEGAQPDDDYDKQERVLTDVQPLCAVAPYAVRRPHCPRLHKVHYEQVWALDVDDGTYLADKDGNLILTADGKRIQFTKNTQGHEEGND